MKKVFDNVLELIGHTPLVRINRLNRGGAEVLVKVESRNPGASVKDRIGVAMIEDAEQRGVLKPGAAADIIVMDYKPFTPFSDENIDGHMLFGMTGRQCQTTIAAGKLLMKDRVLVGIDEEAENAHILEAAKKLWGSLNHCEY